MTADNPIFTRIQEIIDASPVVLFMKGTAQAPLCGFSNLVTQVLNRLNVSFKDVNVLEDETIRQGIKDFTNWPTIPQLYIKGEFIGGCDIVKEMYQSGELQELLKEKGV
jgi:monothiol glutaredoxin